MNIRIYSMPVYSMFIYHNFRYHRAKADINNLAGAVLVRYTKGNAVGAYQYRPHLSIRSPSYWQITVVERDNTDGIRYPVPVITIFQSLMHTVGCRQLPGSVFPRCEKHALQKISSERRTGRGVVEHILKDIKGTGYTSFIQSLQAIQPNLEKERPMTSTTDMTRM